MSQKLVLVTGVTGFIAGHVAEQLLQSGYRVRGTARSAKANTLQETVKVPGLEFAAIDDVATSDFTEALKGVHAVFHVAAPLPGKASADETIKTAVEGSLNVLRQGEKAGIEKFVVTSSFGAVVESSLRPAFAGLNFTDSDWAPVTRDDLVAHQDDPYYTYFAAKAISEKAVWDFAREHPNLDIATILPGFVYGPFAKHFPKPTSVSGLGTNSFPYLLINGQVPPAAPPYFVDVRDVAKAHVRALSLSPSKSVEAKRFLINGGLYSWKEAAQYLKKARPELNVVDPEKIGDAPGPVSTLDTTRAKEVLDFGEYIPFEKTLEDVVNDLAEIH
ncbi:hypothetical protein EST38_g12620 [Candolleomyces aberdarensis]|uniref:NAD-dependent epimerase/dehydratase domain-containing protein n=1 Tax=Candolleomyces aberdarensis TaxID=2316362 RepID=A0A4Q2D501_9AGAR|nr:hypothetical protein EST38_g12620 [Candolleomyces aberdarensis]